MGFVIFELVLKTLGKGQIMIAIAAHQFSVLMKINLLENIITSSNITLSFKYDGIDLPVISVKLSSLLKEQQAIDIGIIHRTALIKGNIVIGLVAAVEITTTAIKLDNRIQCT